MTDLKNHKNQAVKIINVFIIARVMISQSIIIVQNTVTTYAHMKRSFPETLVSTYHKWTDNIIKAGKNPHQNN
jgi:hypothetical protein